VERLGEVVVGTGGEPGEPVGEQVVRGEEHDRGADAGRAHRLAHVPPVRVRQPYVQHDRVDAGVHRAQRAGPVGRGDDGELFLAEPAREDFAQPVVVLDDEYPLSCGHRVTLPPVVGNVVV
jgi:hypothetical protein